MDLAAKIGELRSATPQQLAERATAVLPPWVSLMLVVAIAWKLAGLTWTLLPAGELSAAALPPGSADGSAAAAAPAYRISDIVEAHLFGLAAAEALVQAPLPEEIPEERAALTLRGTIAGREPDNGLAIIAEDRGEEKVYAVGDSVQGARLYQVYPDRVILERGGQLTALRLPRESEVTRTTSARVATPRARAAAPLRTSANLRQAISQDPGRLTDIVRPQPVFANGQQRGYRVYPGRNRQQFASLGLQAGDLVTEINGMSLTDPQSGMEIFRSLGDGGQVTITVERNGQPEVLVLDTSTLTSAMEAAGAAPESGEQNPNEPVTE